MIELAREAAKKERALTIGIADPGNSDIEAELAELAELLRNLKIIPLEAIVVNNRETHSRFKIGSGKAEEIAQLAQESEVDYLVFDEPLTPSQQRNWEKLAKCKVIDREEVILEIFAQRAQTREAVLQVDLARAKYYLPRLTGAWTHLSRQRGGGVTARGQGEAQIETDRRLLKNRIRQLESELVEVRKSRTTQRKSRLRRPVMQGAIVGYTNVGKSSLLEALSNKSVAAADQLFATLDPLARQITLPGNLDVVLSDTVGFIRKLPHTLVEAFRSTLEEALIADFLLLVLDCASSEVDMQWQTTMEVLSSLGADPGKIQVVFNKIDRIPLEDRPFRFAHLSELFPEAVFVSAKSGEGLEKLKHRFAILASKCRCRLAVQLPPGRHDLAALAHRCGMVESSSYDEAGNLDMLFTIDRKYLHLFDEFVKG